MDSDSSLSYPEGLSEYAIARFETEIEFWSKPHPNRYFAQPFPLPDGKLDIMRWSCGFPGVSGTPWEKGYFRFFLKYNEYFPFEPPECRFGEAPFHPNVAIDGSYSVPFLTFGWNPEFSIEAVIVITQDMIHTPTFYEAVQWAPREVHREDPNEFFECVRRDAEMKAYHCVMPPF